MPHITVDRTLASSALSSVNVAEVITSENIIPGNAPADGEVRFQVDLPELVRVNPLTQMRIVLERFDGVEWREIAGQNYVGADYRDEDGVAQGPTCSALVTSGGSVGGVRNPRNKRGWRVRGRIVLPLLALPITLGWRLEIIHWN